VYGIVSMMAALFVTSGTVSDDIVEYTIKEDVPWLMISHSIRACLT
jgi:hypothetical protein